MDHLSVRLNAALERHTRHADTCALRSQRAYCQECDQLLKDLIAAWRAATEPGAAS